MDGKSRATDGWKNLDLFSDYDFATCERVAEVREAKACRVGKAMAGLSAFPR
jgi:hypothetical protein